MASYKYISSKKNHDTIPPAQSGKEYRNMLFFAIIIVLLVIISVSVILLKPAEKQGVIIPYPQANNSANESVPEDCGDSCWLEKGVGQHSAYACEQIENDTVVQSCFEQISNYSKEACIQLLDSAKKKQCIISNAVSEKSADLCNNLQSVADQDECFAKVDSCYLKKAGVERNTCYAIATGNYSLCSGNEDCLLDFVQATNNSAPCGSFQLSSKQHACMAIAQGVDWCEGLQYNSERGQCFATYAVWTNKSYLCDQIAYDTSYALECYQSFAISERNHKYCLYLDFNNRWSCYENYSIGTKDVSGCVEINKYAEVSRTRCFVDFAMQVRNPGACAYLNDSAKRLNCYYQSVMMDTRDPIPPENCANVTISTWKDKCYLLSATGNSDASTCNLISDLSMFNTCLAKFVK